MTEVIHNDIAIHNSNDVRYSSYTQAQKRATQKYRESNKEKMNEQRKKYYEVRKESDPEFLAYKRQKAKEYYQRKKALKELQTGILSIEPDTEPEPEVESEPVAVSILNMPAPTPDPITETPESIPEPLLELVEVPVKVKKTRVSKKASKPIEIPTVTSESVSIVETNPEPLPSVVDTNPKKPIGKPKFIPPIVQTEA